MLSYEQWLFVALTCSTEVSSVPEGLISGCKEFLNSAVYSVHFVLHIVCCPEWALFLLFFFFPIVSIYGSEHKNSFSTM